MDEILTQLVTAMEGYLKDTEKNMAEIRRHLKILFVAHEKLRVMKCGLYIDFTYSYVHYSLSLGRESAPVFHRKDDSSVDLADLLETKDLVSQRLLAIYANLPKIMEKVMEALDKTAVEVHDLRKYNESQIDKILNQKAAS